ncbi:MAG TPA: TIGR03364 family FAD-dependent oxidoreductase [Frankiaceae bacterium]|nr:TIGR03364 family FAD-dependent oxidoreductase [Frankiaceae bacterium]
MRVLVVGGGVLGAMHALWAHDAGHQIVHLEREPAARGASVRNFGLVWVGGRAPGEELRLAQAARDMWTQVAEQIPAVGLRAEGSLTVARTEDELLVMKEASGLPDAAQRGYRLLDPAGVRTLNPALRGATTGGLYCSRDAIVEPRQVPAAIREHLRKSARYRWNPGTEATAVRPHGIRDGHGEWHNADVVICCTGAAHRGVAAHNGPQPLRRVRLQMLQTAPLDERLTTSVADGDSLRYYPAYELPARRHLGPQSATGAAWGSQLLMVQRANGELTIGDTHAYAEPFPFDVEEAPYEQLRMSAEALLGQKLPPTMRRWAGVYSETTNAHPYHRSELAPGVLLVTGPGGKGMTCSPAIAAETFAGLA